MATPAIISQFRDSKIKEELKKSKFDFNYDLTKENFEKLQLNYFQKKKTDIVQGTLKLWSREKVDVFIKHLLDCGNKDWSFVPEEVSDYEVVTDESTAKHKLVSKSRRYRSQRVEVVPWEDSFEVVLRVHRRLGHRGSCRKIFRHVLKKYVIDKIWISFILRSCNMCEAQADFRKTLTSSLKYLNKPVDKHYEIFIQKMPTPDAPFHLILIVVDIPTNFVHLRPVTSFSASEIALELMKIFTDFGIPKFLLTREVYFYERVSKMLTKFTDGVKISVLALQMTEPLPWGGIVMSHLQEWMSVNNSQAWSMGSQFVQWQLNNTLYDDYVTPYQYLFNEEPDNDLIG